ncbi:MAG TPA: nuclear transport factor 2 family protein [Candidatus Angelobacter sp.]|nr:nuclear transport factor 2 family protein [Candidatus Angelobacter sp.]
MKSGFCLLLLCSLAHAAACTTGQKKDEATLIQIEQTWVRVAEQRDMAGLACLLAAEFEEATFTGQVVDRAQMLAPPAGDGGSHVELTEMHARVYGNVGYARGLAVIRHGNQPPVKNLFTDIFVYRDGRWQCVAGHESRFP